MKKKYIIYIPSWSVEIEAENKAEAIEAGANLYDEACQGYPEQFEIQASEKVEETKHICSCGNEHMTSNA